MKKLFGTDGIRGRANRYPMTPEMALNLGRAVAEYFKGTGPGGVIVGKDTRGSGSMLEHAIISGICSMGVDARPVGVIPTPGVAYITRIGKGSAGVVISASHNPYFDNGIKIFRGDGYKMTDREEEELEARLEDIASRCVPAEKIGRVKPIGDGSRSYADFLKNCVTEGVTFDKFNIVIDCANGAASRIAVAVLTELGANVVPLSYSPDGMNINENCGSEHTENLRNTVLEFKADIGFAFDGDADRVIAVDETGKEISGDEILFIAAENLKQKGELSENIVVATVMSNIGLKAALADMGIEILFSDVGDRYVKEKMIESKAVLGGENSGHVIWFKHQTTGDGILTALHILETMASTNKRASELAGNMELFPQKIINVDVSDKPDLKTIPRITEAIESVEQELGDAGRVLVRYSGTQPLCRVMVEGRNPDKTETFCKQIAVVIQEEIGS